MTTLSVITSRTDVSTRRLRKHNDAQYRQQQTYSPIFCELQLFSVLYSYSGYYIWYDTQSRYLGLVYSTTVCMHFVQLAILFQRMTGN